jgi:hypothetical protein
MNTGNWELVFPAGPWFPASDDVSLFPGTQLLHFKLGIFFLVAQSDPEIEKIAVVAMNLREIS